MSRVLVQTLKSYTNLLKLNSRSILKPMKLVRMPNIYIPKKLFSDETTRTTIKTSLTGLIVGGLNENKYQESEEAEMQKLRESSWKTMKYTLLFFGVTTVGLSTYLISEFGKPPLDEAGAIVPDEFSELPVWKQYIYRTLRELDYYKRLIREPSRDKLLPDELTFPYYQPKYTLVLELTDVLVHPEWTYQTGWRFKKRPGIDYFLEMLTGTYEIVVFTAEQGMTVFPIIEALDPKNLIAYKLVRDATHFVDGHHVKNLAKLNRDLRKVVVVDWNPESVQFHKENMFQLDRWSGNDDDTTLGDLAAFLIIIANSEVDDVRDVLQHYNTFENGLDQFKENQRIIYEQEAAKNLKVQSPLPPRTWPKSLINKPSSSLI